MKKHNSAASRGDYFLLFLTMVLVAVGTIMIFSSSVIVAEERFKTPYIFVFKQLIWLCLGFSAMFFLAKFNFRNLQKFARPITIATIILLTAVLFFGSRVGGARRWLHFGFLSFQPSEIAKIAMVIAVCDYIDRKKSKIRQWSGMMPALSLVMLFVIPIALEPDLGTPIIMLSTTFILLYLGGANLMHLVLTCLAAAPMIAFEIYRKPYRLHRIKAFFESWGDINSSSYQVDKSLLALGSGGVFGKGLAQGQMKLFYLPEPHTDFIFPIIGEELGFLGAVTIIILFVMILWRGWEISSEAQNYFGSMLAMGMTLLVALQASLNMGVACGLLPTKGLPLPFVSFGGSALLANLAEIGILLSISSYKRT